MQNRRKFIRNSAGLAAGSLAIPSFAKSFFVPSYPPPGIQLFTFFDVMDADVEGTLKRIAKIGYVEIESAFSKKGGYYGYSCKRICRNGKKLWDLYGNHIMYWALLSNCRRV